MAVSDVGGGMAGRAGWHEEKAKWAVGGTFIGRLGYVVSIAEYRGPAGQERAGWRVLRARRGGVFPAWFAGLDAANAFLVAAIPQPGSRQSLSIVRREVRCGRRPEGNTGHA